MVKSWTQWIQFVVNSLNLSCLLSHLGKLAPKIGRLCCGDLPIQISRGLGRLGDRGSWHRDGLMNSRPPDPGISRPVCRLVEPMIEGLLFKILPRRVVEITRVGSSRFLICGLTWSVLPQAQAAQLDFRCLHVRWHLGGCPELGAALVAHAVVRASPHGIQPMVKALG